MSADREMSLADRFVAVMADINAIDADVDNDNPHRFPIRLMRRSAEKAISDALRTAFDIADCARVLKKELKEAENHD